MRNNTLRCYFGDIRCYPELGGIAVLAYNARAAKRYIWNHGELSDNEYTDVRVRWMKDVRFDRIPEKNHQEGHILDFEEGYRSGAYADVEGDACLCCGSTDCESGCAVLDEMKKEEALEAEQK